MNKFVETSWACSRTLLRWGLVYAAVLAALMLLRLLG